MLPLPKEFLNPIAFTPQYPMPELLKELYSSLNHISDEALMGVRLHKLELKELGNALAIKIIKVLSNL